MKKRLVIWILTVCLASGVFCSTAAAKEADESVGVTDENIAIEVISSPEEAALAVMSENKESGSDAGEEPNRLVLRAEGEIDTTYGAAEGFYYAAGNEYVLEYDSRAEADRAYEQLAETYGEEQVYADSLIRLEQQPGTEEKSGQPEQANGEVVGRSEGDESGLIGENIEQLSTDSFDGLSLMGLTALKEEMKDAGGEVTVAVIDSGIDTDHPWFAGRLAGSSANLVNEEPLTDYHGHGTHVAGIIAQGTPAQVKIMAIQIFDSSGVTTLFALRCALDYAREHGADVVNMSIGGENIPQEDKKMVDAALADAVHAGAFLCIAAGNERMDVQRSYPAGSYWTVSVGAFGEAAPGEYVHYGQSNTGSLLDFSAPGVDIESAWNDGGTDVESGTSMACPHLAAAAAMVKLKHPAYTQWDIYAALRDHVHDLGEPGKDGLFGYGYVDLSGYKSSETPAADGKLYQGIEADAVITRQLKDGNFALQASVSRGDGKLTVQSTDSGIASVKGDRITLHKAGICELILTAGETAGYKKTERRIQLVVSEDDGNSQPDDQKGGSSSETGSDTGKKKPQKTDQEKRPQESDTSEGPRQADTGKKRQESSDQGGNREVRMKESEYEVTKEKAANTDGTSDATLLFAAVIAACAGIAVSGSVLFSVRRRGGRRP